MWVVGRVKVLEKIVGSGKKGADKESSGGTSERTLGSYISREKMGLVKEKAEGAFGGFRGEVARLVSRPCVVSSLVKLSFDYLSRVTVELEARFQDVKSTVEGLQAGSEEVSSVVAGFT